MNELETKNNELSNFHFQIYISTIELETFPNATNLFQKVKTKNICNQNLVDLTIVYLAKCFEYKHFNMLATIIEPLLILKCQEVDQNIELQRYLCVYYFQQHEIKKSIIAGKIAFDRAHPSSFITRYLARSYIKMKKYQKAWKLLKVYLNSNPDVDSIYLEMARFCLLSQTKLNKVEGLIQKARLLHDDKNQGFDHYETLEEIFVLQAKNKNSFEKQKKRKFIYSNYMKKK